ncbi:MAG: glycosyltransferase family 39 protein [Bacteroidota bacterium]
MTKKKKTRKKPIQSISNKADHRTWFLVFLFGLSCLLYANTLGHQYAFDDSIVITDNPYTQMGFKGIPKLLTSDFFEGIYGFQTELTGGRYRPLSLLTFAIEYQFFGGNPMPGHLCNIIFYALTILMIFLVLEQWFGRKSVVPYLASLFFLIHPIHTEVVANIKSRDELLCFLLLLGSLFQFFKWAQKEGQVKHLIWSGVFYFLSLLAKETAITYLPVYPIILFYFNDLELRKSIPKVFPLLGIAIAYLVIRISLVGMIGGEDSSDIMENPFVNSGFVEKYATISVILLKYFGLLFFPNPLTSDYSFNQIPLVSFSDPFALIGLALYALLVIYMIINLGKKNIFAFSILLFLAPLSIVSNIVFNIGAPMGERFLFVPSFGFALALTWALNIWLIKDVSTIQPLRAIKNNIPLVCFLALITVAASIKTIQRNFDWYDNNTLFAKDVISSANSAKMQYYYANTFIGKYMDDKKPENRSFLDTAEYHLQLGLEINPEFVFCLYNMGLVKSNKDEGEAAKYYLEETLRLQPGHKKAFRMLGEVHGRLLQNYDLALYYLETAKYQYGDNEPGTLQNLANVYAMKGQFSKAIPIYQELIAIDPTKPGYFINLGLTYQSLGNQAKAEENFAKARALDPSIQ